MNIINKTEGEVLFCGKELTKDNIELKKLIDLNGVNVFKNLGIAPLISILEKKVKKYLTRKNKRL